MQLKQLFYLTLLSIPVVSAVFPYYDMIHTELTGLYAHFNPDEPIFTKVVFWGSFFSSTCTTINKGLTVCEQCEGKKEGSKWDCADAVIDLVESVCLNAISLYIGWQQAGTPKKALEGTDTTVLKRHLRGDVKKSIFTIGIVLVLGFLIIMSVLLLMDGMRCHIMDSVRGILNYLTNNATDVIYHLIFNPQTETTGAITT